MNRTASPRQGRTDSRREELVAATRRVITQDGFGRATVGAITREAGASTGLLNYHFTSKDDVVAAAFADIAREELEELAERSRAHERPVDRLAAIVDLFDWWDAPGWRLWVDGWGESMHVEALRATLERFASGWRSVLAHAIEDGVRDGAWECDDHEDTAARLVAALDGIGLHLCLYGSEVDGARAAAWARRLIELELGVSLPELPRRMAERVAPTPHERRIELRGRDLDATGHVLPAVHLTYLEEGREGWLASRFARVGSLPRTTVAHVSLDFEHALARDDRSVLVRCELKRLGRTTIRTRETIATAGGASVVTADVMLIVHDTETGRPRALTPEEREALAQ